MNAAPLRLAAFSISVSVLGVKLLWKWYFLVVVLEVPLKAQIIAQEIFSREALIFSFYLAASSLTFGKRGQGSACVKQPLR